MTTPCEPNPCVNGGQCVSSPGSTVYNCRCPPMFSGVDCESRYNPCSPNPCGDEKCILDDSMAVGYYCQCTECLKAHGNGGIGNVFGAFSRRLFGREAPRHNFASTVSKRRLAQTEKYFSAKERQLVELSSSHYDGKS